MEGYSHHLYAESFSEIGQPFFLPKCKGWLIKRRIPGTDYFDAMGCYPLFSCGDWNRLEEDILELDKEMVSVVLVTDPFAPITQEKLKEIFSFCKLYKEHCVTDFSQSINTSVSKRTIKHAVRALKQIVVERSLNPVEHINEWILLFDHLIQRHNIKGIRAFSEKSFNQLFRIPGFELFVARAGEEIVGAEVFLRQGLFGYAHLVAISPLGYRLNASYALDWTAIQYFSKILVCLDHGSGSDNNPADDGLLQYKRRWATDMRPVFLCGKVINQKAYNEIVSDKVIKDTEYFPAYRLGEYN